jgi:hypothetical protein
MVLTLSVAGAAFVVGLGLGVLRRRHRLRAVRDRMQQKIDALEVLIGLERMRMRNLEDAGELMAVKPWVDAMPDRVTRPRRPATATE